VKSVKASSPVSRLYAHSKNYDMDVTLDYNVELFPLQKDQSFALAIASSLSRTGPGSTNISGDDAAESEKNMWRPDRKGKTGGLDDDYDYVMYGKVCPQPDLFCLDPLY